MSWSCWRPDGSRSPTPPRSAFWFQVGMHKAVADAPHGCGAGGVSVDAALRATDPIHTAGKLYLGEALLSGPPRGVCLTGNGL